MDNILGNISGIDNVIFWSVSVRDIRSYPSGSHVYSPPFSYRGCLWRIGAFVTESEGTFAYLYRELLGVENQTVPVAFALDFRWEHEPAQRQTVTSYLFFSSVPGRSGQCYFLRNENLYNTAKSSNITLSCRFVEGNVSQRMLPPMNPAVCVCAVPHSNQEVATLTLQLSEAHATIRKLTEEKKSNLHKIEYRKNHNKKPAVPHSNQGVATLKLQLSEAHATIRKLTEEKESNLQEIENLKNHNKEPELETLSSDFQALLSSEHNSDVVLKVQDKEFRAHRVVLGARSPVFRAIFSHGSEAEKTGVVTIPDCDPELFPLFLSFLYTGKAEYMTMDTTQQMYSISDKYGVQDLKSICCNHLIQCLTPENVCDIAVLADLHSDDHLASEVQHYFNKNYLQVLATSEWTATSENNLRISNKLLKEMALASSNE